jgi:hypothetical protein
MVRLSESSRLGVMYKHLYKVQFGNSVPRGILKIVKLLVIPGLGLE